MIAVVTDNAVGGHFLCWSMHYLAGHDQYYHSKDNKFKPMPTNPLRPVDSLRPVNAHGFESNWIRQTDEVEEILTGMASCKTSEFQTCYMHWQAVDNRLLANPTPKKLSDSTVESTKIVLKDVLKYANKTVVVSVPPEFMLYYVNYKFRGNFKKSLSDTKTLFTCSAEKNLLTLFSPSRCPDYLF